MPFPIKEVSSPTSQAPSQNGLSEPPPAAGAFSGAAVQEAKLKPEIAPESQISNLESQIVEKPEIERTEKKTPPADTEFITYSQFENPDWKPETDALNNVSSSDISDLKAKFDREQKSTDQDGQDSKSYSSNPKSWDFIASMPVKMLPISSEELEHFDDDKLDTAYENRLSRAGDDLFPIREAVKVAEELIGVGQSNGFSGAPDNPNGSAAAVAPARAKPVFEIPNFDTDDDPDEIPVLSENPTPEELVAYAQKHPSVKKVLRAFRGKIVEVKKL